MKWGNITETQTDDEFFEEYVRLALKTPAPALPPARQHIGACEVNWFETEPGKAFIQASNGSPDDRVLATLVVREQLLGHGIRQAHYSFDGDDDLRKLATWDDIMSKAKRLIQSGQVQILRNGYNNVVGHVQGDHGEYQTEIGRDDPESRAITTWECDCPWDQYAWQRTRQWKKYEGRPCAHVLATYWKSLATPLDEDAHPAQGQQSLFNAPQTQAPGAPSPFQAPTGPPQGQQLPIPGMFPGTAQGTQPQDPGVIPPFPMAPENMPPVPNPASVPGLKQPSPTNPVQYPGGTFSSVQDWDFGWEFHPATHTAAQFQNGSMVSNKHDDWGIWQGKSSEHGAGSQAKIPAGSVGEVLGQDPTTGMIQVLFMGKLTQDHGPLEPYGATAWFMPSEVNTRTDIRPPGPAIRRRSLTI